MGRITATAKQVGGRTAVVGRASLPAKHDSALALNLPILPILLREPLPYFAGTK